MTDIAYAAGFASVRQFNDTIRSVFDASPSQLRRTSHCRDPRPLRTGTCVTSPSVPRAAEPAVVAMAPARTRHPRPLDADAAGFSNCPRPRAGGDRVLPTTMCSSRCTTSICATWVPPSAVCGASSILMRHRGDRRGTVRRSARRTRAGRPGVRVPGSCDPFASVIVSTMVGQQISTAAARTHLAPPRLPNSASPPWTSEDDPRPPLPDTGGHRRIGADVLRGPRRRIDAIVAIAQPSPTGRWNCTRGRCV